MLKLSAFERARRAWFSDYERERLRQKKRQGAKLADFPEPPTDPEQISRALDAVGRRKFLTIAEVHRSTLARWEAGASVMPRAVWLLLVLIEQGRLPGMSSDWRDFRFDGDRLLLTGSRYSYSAREIAGWHYEQAHRAALEREIIRLQKQNAHLLTVGVFGAANDPITCVS